MAVEYELKYRATPEVLERIQADFPGSYTVTEMTTTYYDTPGGDLAKLFWTLRHRREGDRHICTLKTPAGIDGRSEYEWCCEDIHEAIPHLSRSPHRPALHRNGRCSDWGSFRRPSIGAVRRSAPQAPARHPQSCGRAAPSWARASFRRESAIRPR